MFGRRQLDRDDIMTFDTWGAFVTQAEKVGTQLRGSAREVSDHRNSWAGTRTMDEAIKQARYGWKEGEEKVRTLARRLEVKVINRIVREDVNYDVEGMTFDVSRYLNGEPEHWVCIEESTMQMHGQRHVKIMVCVAVSCGVDPETIIARGAAITALIELLEYAGQRVELWIADAESSDVSAHPRYQRYTKVKAYDQPLDVARTAFAVASPACQRRLGFSLMEQTNDATANYIGPYYGISVDVPADKREDVSLYFGKMQGTTNVAWSNPAAAEAWIIAELAAQGVVLRDD